MKFVKDQTLIAIYTWRHCHLVSSYPNTSTMLTGSTNESSTAFVPETTTAQTGDEIIKIAMYIIAAVIALLLILSGITVICVLRRGRQALKALGDSLPDGAFVGGHVRDLQARRVRSVGPDGLGYRNPLHSSMPSLNMNVNMQSHGGFGNRQAALQEEFSTVTLSRHEQMSRGGYAELDINRHNVTKGRGPGYTQPTFAKLSPFSDHYAPLDEPKGIKGTDPYQSVDEVVNQQGDFQKTMNAAYNYAAVDKSKKLKRSNSFSSSPVCNLQGGIKQSVKYDMSQIKQTSPNQLSRDVLDTIYAQPNKKKKSKDVSATMYAKPNKSNKKKRKSDETNPYKNVYVVAEDPYIGQKKAVQPNKGPYAVIVGQKSEL